MLNQQKKRCKYIGDSIFTFGGVYNLEINILQYGIAVNVEGISTYYNNLIEFAADWQEVLENDDE